eukprot:364664-Chlamydomonas_euryale.AAC.15
MDGGASEWTRPSPSSPPPPPPPPSGRCAHLKPQTSKPTTGNRYEARGTTSRRAPLIAPCRPAPSSANGAAKLCSALAGGG